MAINIVDKSEDQVKIRHVICSVYDKNGLDEFVPEMVSILPDVRIYSTGGTYKTLETILGKQAANNLTSVSAFTGQPEMQGGLVKTLDYKIYLGLLSESYNPAHSSDLSRVGAVPIDMVIVNLYPFQQTVASASVTAEQARSNIDIGGPCMVRASAKNFLRVAIVTSPADYPSILSALKKHDGCLSLAKRFILAQKAFQHTADYDTAIATYLGNLSYSDVHHLYQFPSSKQT